MDKLIFKTTPKTVVDTYEVEIISDRLTYVYGEFLKIRGNRPRDIRTFSKCPCCQEKHDLKDRVYSAFNVKKNSKYIGNRFACQSCYNKYGSMNI